MAVLISNANETETTVTYEGAVLATRERNGYHDSDFYAVVWDEEAGRLTTVEYGTTRFPSCGSAEVDATDEVIEKARAWTLEATIRREISHEARRVEEPGPGGFEKGDRLRLLEPVTFTDKKTGEVVEAAAGEAGTVIWKGSFGTFYRNGANRPDRGNTRVGVKFAGERVVFAPLKKFRLDREALTDEEVRERETAWTAGTDPAVAYAASIVTPGYAFVA